MRLLVIYIMQIISQNVNPLKTIIFKFLITYCIHCQEVSAKGSTAITTSKVTTKTRVKRLNLKWLVYNVETQAIMKLLSTKCIHNLFNLGTSNF